MAAPVARIVPLIAIVIALGLLGWSLFAPWWGLARESQGSRRWERHAPFDPDDRAVGDAFETETRVLGILVAGALTALFLAAVTRVVALARASRGRVSSGLLVLGALAAVAAVLYPVFAFPAEANEGRDTDLGFIGRDCVTGTFSICYVARADLGWGLAVAAGLLALGAMAAERLGRLDPEPEVRVAASTVAPVAVVRPRPAAGSVPAAASAPTRVTKCPQCQTRVSYRKPFAGAALAECHNCGLRFPA